jgi:hypothetical protein
MAKNKEQWRTIKDYPNYAISDQGRIRGPKSVTEGQLTRFGYRSKVLRNEHGVKGKRIHRLVMQEFVGPSELEVNHINGIKTDNRLINLEYVTRTENIRHSYKIGTHKGPKGEEHGRAKLTWEAVRYIRASKEKADVLAKKFGVKVRTIDAAKYYENWKEAKWRGKEND